MRTAVVLLLSLILTGCDFSDGTKKRSGKPESEHNLSVEQKAALELGYFYGSKINLVAMPQPLRNKSFAGIDYNDDQLVLIFENLHVIKPSAEGFVNLTHQALSNNNPIEAGKKLLDIVNAVKTTLSLVFPNDPDQPQIWRVYRIGYALGYELELAAIVSRNKPTGQSIATFTGLSQKMRIAMPEDLSESKLPDVIKGLIRDTNIEVNNTEDLENLVKVSQEFYNLIRSEK